MRRAVLIIACVALAGCRGEPEVDARNASVEDVARQVDEARANDFVRPGKWQSKVTIEQLDLPGMPAEMAESMKKMMAQHQERTTESCLTPEEAKRPKEDFFAGKDNNCRYEHFTMGDGKIDARMRCTQGSINQVMEMEGTYSPEQYELRMTSSMEGAPEPASNMSMRMRIEARRVGECEPVAG